MDIVVVDSGTSTTRARLWRNGSVAWSDTRDAGARNTAIDGHPGQIREALRSLLITLHEQTDATPYGVVCSGMITSNVGLFEVPHLSAPAGPDDLARGLVRRDMPDITDLPLYFVRGVKTLPASSDLDHLADADILRGEEAEIVGLRELLSLTDDAVFLHFGSHHKAIWMDGDGTIRRSRTAITGELYDVVSRHTILKSSVLPLDELELDREHCRMGLAHALAHGFGRTLFLVRVGEQIGGRSATQMTSYLVGALAAEDVRLVQDGSDAPIVPYGKGAFPEVLTDHFQREGRTVVPVDAETADRSAALGAARLFQRHTEILGSGR